MRALDRKLLRDLWQMKGQALAICLVLASGVATFVMSLSLRASLQLTQDAYYERYRFADVFTSLKRAPAPLAARIAEIPGVAQVQTRIVVDVTLDVRGLPEPAVGRLISIPERPPPVLNDLYLRSGRYIESGRTGEVLVHEAFASSHGLHPGDTVKAVINGRLQKLRIVGIALAPEYVFLIRGGEMLPDSKRFGVFWMGRTDLAAAYDMQGAFNDVALKLAPGASESEVVRRLDRLTETYGGLGAYGRADQMSHRFVSNEIRQLGSVALVAPILFLGVAAFLLNVVLNRMISTQREQIAALKAFGYSHWEVGAHYFKFVLLLVALGAALGTGVGIALGAKVTGLYTKFFHFPMLIFQMDRSVLPIALGVSVLAATIGTIGAVRRAVHLPPAEAMRPEPPARYNVTLLERVGLQRILPPPVRMILRHLARQPVKTLFAILGISLAVGILILGNFIVDAIDGVIDHQFYNVQQHDMSVSFVEPIALRALHEIEHLPGVIHGEPFRSVPARVHAGQVTRRLGIQGLEPDRALFRLLDEAGRPVALPPEGLLLNFKLGAVLGVRIGDTLELEVLEAERPRRRVVVAGFIDDYMGLSAYMTRAALHRLMREGDRVSGVHLRIDPLYQDELYRRLKATPKVASVTVKQASLTSFRETVAENLMTIRAFYAVFGIIIASGVVYNSARISLSERSRDLATLRVLGFTRYEISVILLGELAVMTLAALLPGMAIGHGFAGMITQAADTEDMRFPLLIEPSTYALAVLVVLMAAAVSGLIVRRQLDRLDLVAVLKSRE
jgi:putative ABC transport system permease protein